MLRGQLWRLQGKSWARPLRGRGATVLKTTEPRTLRAPPCRCSREAAQPGETSVEVDDVATAQAAAKELGYPVMLKAVSGGGGIGMVPVNSAEELASKWEPTMRMAEQHFGDGRFFLEKKNENTKALKS